MYINVDGKQERRSAVESLRRHSSSPVDDEEAIHFRSAVGRAPLIIGRQSRDDPLGT